MEELKACPFCGENDRLMVHNQSKAHYVECLVCGACGPVNKEKDCHAGKVKAIADWNRRAAPENKPLTMEQLRRMDGKPVWWWNKSDKPRLTICDSSLYKPDLLFISYDWIEDDTVSITPYKRIIKWGYKPYARKPEGSTS